MARSCSAPSASWHGTSLIPPNTITVKVEHGVVTLNGVVEWGYQRTPGGSFI